MRRFSVPELLDTDAGTAEEIADSLLDLQSINRFLGGYSTTRELIQRVRLRKQLSCPSYLDVGGASGSSLPSVEVTVIDRAASHLANTTVARICGDAFHLPFRNDSYDVCGSSLFMHHLEPTEIAPFIRESLRVARHAVLINDLRRSATHYVLARLGRVVYKSRITVFDAPASVRRAYTQEEIATILEPFKSRFEITRHFFYRMGVIIWK